MVAEDRFVDARRITHDMYNVVFLLPFLHRAKFEARL